LEVRPQFGPNISIPYGLKLQLTDSNQERESFQILEGAYKGTTASVKRKGPNQSFLVDAMRRDPPGSVRFELGKQALYLGARGPYNAFSGGGFGGFTPVSPGKYQLSIPPFPARATRTGYGRWTRYHRMWFRIGTDPHGSRFLHPGEISEGCVTVRQFISDPLRPQPGFEDLPRLGRDYPTAIGLPMPARPAPIIGWDAVFDYLILARLNDQSVGTLVVSL
jgi:hypothetical protein